ncbi:MAG: PIN domain-containing protein [Sphingorhabdus sp.]
MSNFIIDSSALLALLQDELTEDAQKIEEQIRDAAITSVNFGEAAQRLYRSGKTRADMDNIARMMGLDVVAVDADLALDVADFREVARMHGISQADCLCLALAKREAAVALTGDRDWLKIADAIGVEVQLIR